jgi:hypothetical protein
MIAISRNVNGRFSMEIVADRSVAHRKDWLTQFNRKGKNETELDR